MISERLIGMAARLLQRDDPEGAEAAAALACETAPTNARAWSVLATARAKRRCYGEAVPAYSKALALDAQAIDVWCNLGETYLALGDYGSAAAALRRALELDPKAADPFGRRARALVARTLKQLGSL